MATKKEKPKAAKHAGGRPHGITPEIQKSICDTITAGGFIETAIAVAGVPKATFYDWMKRGAKSSHGSYREFSDEVKKALAIAETKFVQVIGDASATQWQAAAWMLERRFRKNWSRNLETTSAPTSSQPKSANG